MKTEMNARAQSGGGVAVQRIVSTFDETFRDGEYRRAGIEVKTRIRRVRLGWICGYIPTFFFAGRLASYKQTQLRVWRLAISYCANTQAEPRPGESPTI